MVLTEDAKVALERLEEIYSMGFIAEVEYIDRKKDIMGDDLVNNAEIATDIRDNEDGTNQISFCPENRGQHQIEVGLISDEGTRLAVRQSPFLVDVYPSPFSSAEAMNNYNLSVLLHKILTQVRNGTRRCVDILPEDCEELLAQDELYNYDVSNRGDLIYYAALSEIGTSEMENILSENSQFTPFGFPRKPLYLEMSKTIVAWVECSRFPMRFKPFFMLNEISNDIERLDNFTPAVMAFAENWKTSDESTKEEGLASLLESFEKKGICTLLKLRRTVGSFLQFPAGIGTLLQACNQLHAPTSSSRLTVAGRALCKHAMRSTDQWWGSSQGPEDGKNSRAERIIQLILEDAAWINIHRLPHELPIFEVRNEHGYGARWSADGKQFRGFLEPQMADGHDKGWVH